MSHIAALFRHGQTVRRSEPLLANHALWKAVWLAVCWILAGLVALLTVLLWMQAGVVMA